MRSADQPSAQLRRDGDVLHLSGALVVATVAAIWKPALVSLVGIRRIDVSTVDRVDSSGVALLAELVHRSDGADVVGEPVGLDALRAAYRLTPGLDFAS